MVQTWCGTSSRLERLEHEGRNGTLSSLDHTICVHFHNAPGASHCLCADFPSASPPSVCSPSVCSIHKCTQTRRPNSCPCRDMHQLGLLAFCLRLDTQCTAILKAQCRLSTSPSGFQSWVDLSATSDGEPSCRAGCRLVKRFAPITRRIGHSWACSSKDSEICPPQTLRTCLPQTLWTIC